MWVQTSWEGILILPFRSCVAWGEFLTLSGGRKVTTVPHQAVLRIKRDHTCPILTGGPGAQGTCPAVESRHCLRLWGQRQKNLAGFFAPGSTRHFRGRPPRVGDSPAAGSACRLVTPSSRPSPRVLSLSPVLFRVPCAFLKHSPLSRPPCSQSCFVTQFWPRRASQHKLSEVSERATDFLIKSRRPQASQIVCRQALHVLLLGTRLRCLEGEQLFCSHEAGSCMQSRRSRASEADSTSHTMRGRPPPDPSYLSLLHPSQPLGLL